jgi:hypothetical protein
MNSRIVFLVAVRSQLVITTSSNNITVLRYPTPCSLIQE